MARHVKRPTLMSAMAGEGQDDLFRGHQENSFFLLGAGEGRFQIVHARGIDLRESQSGQQIQARLNGMREVLDALAETRAPVRAFNEQVSRGGGRIEGPNDLNRAIGVRETFFVAPFGKSKSGVEIEQRPAADDQGIEGGLKTSF